MKILLSNKFYYPRGGDCIYSLELEKLLLSNGHNVAFFAMQHPENIHSKYSEYFPSEVNFSDKGIKNIFKASLRLFGTKEVKNKFIKLLNDFKPDIVHLNNIHSQLSPVIADIAYKSKIPIVWTLHDFKLVCPSYSCLRANAICELCFKNKFNIIKHRCLKGLTGSLLAYIEAIFWNAPKIIKYTSKFISPSYFLKNKLTENGFPSEKIKVINNFIDSNRIASEIHEKQNYYCYVGRLSKEKGIESLLKASAKTTDFKLLIIGVGPLLEELRKEYNKCHIIFTGIKTWKEVQELIQRSKFLVTPSICYENSPLSIIEAFAQGTPVLGANIGGIPELIKEGFNGLLFKSGDIDDLEYKVEQMFNTSFDSKAIMDDARKNYSSEIYYEKLIKIYEEILNKQ